MVLCLCSLQDWHLIDLQCNDSINFSLLVCVRVFVCLCMCVCVCACAHALCQEIDIKRLGIKTIMTTKSHVILKLEDHL